MQEQTQPCFGRSAKQLFNLPVSLSAQSTYNNPDELTSSTTSTTTTSTTTTSGTGIAPIIVAPCDELKRLARHWSSCCWSQRKGSSQQWASPATKDKSRFDYIGPMRYTSRHVQLRGSLIADSPCILGQQLSLYSSFVHLAAATIVLPFGELVESITLAVT